MTILLSFNYLSKVSFVISRSTTLSLFRLSLAIRRFCERVSRIGVTRLSKSQKRHYPVLVVSI